MPVTFAAEHAGRRAEVVPDGFLRGSRVRLLVDGEQVAEAKAKGTTTLEGGGVRVKVRASWDEGRILHADLEHDDGAVPMRPVPGTELGRRIARDHPDLYAARHVAAGAAQAAVAIIGLGFLLRLLPELSIDLPALPSIDLPDLPLPSVDLPSVDLPEAPGWVRAVMDAKEIWLPILIGLGIAAREMSRRRRSDPKV